MTWLALFTGMLFGGLTGWVAGMLTIFKAFGHIIDLGKRMLVAQAAAGAPSGGTLGLGRREASEPQHTQRAGV
jgi:hypothetical protein